MLVYACTAGTENRARCRNWADANGLLCPFHQKRRDAGETVTVAPSPDTILVKFNINPNWTEKFKALGIPQKTPDFQKHEQEHVRQAEANGREAYRYRPIADSGVPVFGKEGLTNVTLFDLLQELLSSSDYNLTNIHLFQRRDKGVMNVLVITFSKEGENMTFSAADELMKFLASSCWGHCHVWANPPREDGRVLHTINSSHREVDKDPEGSLSFNTGLWSMTAVTAPVSA